MRYSLECYDKDDKQILGSDFTHFSRYDSDRSAARYNRLVAGKMLGENWPYSNRVKVVKLFRFTSIYDLSSYRLVTQFTK